MALIDGGPGDGLIQAEAVVSGLGGGQTIFYRRWLLRKRFDLSQVQVEHLIREARDMHGREHDYEIDGIDKHKHCGKPRVAIWKRKQIQGFQETWQRVGAGCPVCGHYKLQ